MITLRWIWATAIAVFLTISSLSAFAQETAQPDAPSANDLHELSRLLADERIQDWLQAQANETDERELEKSISIRDQFQEASDHVRARVTNLSSAWSKFDQAPDVIAQKWREQVTPDRQVRSLTFLLIFVFFGAGL